jgi:asparagine synthetase B (glutamine-hydrolysing)
MREVMGRTADKQWILISSLKKIRRLESREIRRLEFREIRRLEPREIRRLESMETRRLKSREIRRLKSREIRRLESREIRMLLRQVVIRTLPLKLGMLAAELREIRMLAAEQRAANSRSGGPTVSGGTDQGRALCTTPVCGHFSEDIFLNRWA